MIEPKTMKVIFVGIHNKEGKSPLDSSTQTGKIVDKIIAATKEYLDVDFIKTNLFNSTEIPKDTITPIASWVIRNPVDEFDIVIWLGKDVQKHSPVDLDCHTIKAEHPAGIHYSGKTESQYIREIKKNILAHCVSIAIK